MPLDPQVKEFLDALAAVNPPGWETMAPAQAREVFSGMGDIFGQPEPIAHVKDETVAGTVPVRVYRPDGDGKLPLIMYYHGGGWVLGNRNTHDTLCRRLANRASSVVVSVEYRLAPEAKFPAQLDDCYAATKYVCEHAETFDVDATRIAVAGDSAGGNLAAAVGMRARDRGGPPICHQLLFYPIANHRFDTPSYQQFAQGFGLTRAGMQWFWENYLTTKDDASSPYASLLLAKDLTKLPAATVVTAEYDVLRDEGEAYAAQLTKAGVNVTLRRYDGMIHGFTHFAGAFDRGKQSVDDAAAVLRDVFVR